MSSEDGPVRYYNRDPISAFLQFLARTGNKEAHNHLRHRYTYWDTTANDGHGGPHSIWTIKSKVKTK